MAENRDVLVRMKEGKMKMEVTPCSECGAEPVMERADGKIYLYCPVCGASHASVGEDDGEEHLVNNWNEAMLWLEKANIPVCSGCRPVGGPCTECDIPL